MSKKKPTIADALKIALKQAEDEIAFEKAKHNITAQAMNHWHSAWSQELSFNSTTRRARDEAIKRRDELAGQVASLTADLDRAIKAWGERCTALTKALDASGSRETVLFQALSDYQVPR